MSNLLDQFVKDKATEIDFARSELKRNTEGLDKARNDALKAAQDSEKILTEMNSTLEKQRNLQKQMIGRHIDPRQRAFLIAFWKKSDKGHVVVLAKRFDEESERFADELTDVLKESGFDAKRGHDPMSFGTSGQWMVVKKISKYIGKESYVGAI